MIIIKNFLDNNFYFWLLGFSFAFISYISIYDSLVVNNPLINSNASEAVVNSRNSLSLLKQGLSFQYILIPINFIKLFSIFVTGQILSIFIFKTFYKINLSSKYFIFTIFLLGCSIHYLFAKLVY
tara:strand:+ start:2049 stop:2423 length:375 start_codon:yes stop_codon:yes gene_type:complete